MPNTRSSSELTIRAARENDRDAILDFIREMGFNPRDAVTWDGLRMTAVTAWADGRLVGAIPLEPRPLQLAPGRVVTTLHQTAVAVHPEFRGRGVGSKLQSALEAEPPAPAELTTVFREEPESAAYRWYVRNGFRVAMHVDSWFVDEPESCIECLPLPVLPGKAGEGVLRQVTHSIGETVSGKGPLPNPPPECREREPCVDASTLLALWRKAQGDRFGGFVDRNQRPLEPWLTVHPYRARYQFHFVTLPSKAGELAGYALLGVGRLHSETERADILELIADSQQSREEIVCTVLVAAATNGWRPVRWPIAVSDGEAVELAARLGFERRWGFDLLAKPLNVFSLEGVDLSQWRYASVDYI